MQNKNPYINKQPNTRPEITDEGKAYLAMAVTDTSSSVYGFYPDKLSSITIAAAMARLSRREDDLRITILDEFTEISGKDSDLLRRVITAYGDDSVQQLVGQHIVIEGASNLLTKQLERGRLAAYLEQSTRYIYFDQKDEAGRYKYYVPSHLPEKILTRYRSDMDRVFDIYSDLVHRLTEYVREQDDTPADERDGAWRAATKAQACDAVRPLLPVATKSTVGIYASAQAIEMLILRLQGSDSREAQYVGDEILTQMRKVIPAFLERADKPERGGATIAYRSNVRRMIQDMSRSLPTSSQQAPSVELTDYTMSNELDIVPHILYEQSRASLRDLRDYADTLDKAAKADIIAAYIGERLNRRHRPGRAFEIPHYTFDIVCDYGIFRDLQRHRIVDALEWQSLTPHLGFDVPDIIKKAGLTDDYNKAYTISYQLYAHMCDQGAAYEAQYATLLGHNMRWTITLNAREAFHMLELRTTPQGHPGYRKICKQMFDAIASAHPVIASHMIFINRDEDPALTRLAAERATQYKLEQLQ